MGKLLLVGLLAIVFIAGCVAAPAGTGTLQLKITDKADNISSLVLTISEIRVHKATGEIMANQSEGRETNETDTAGWISVVGSKTIDLIQVKDIKEILGETELEEGKYTQIRLLISNATATIDGEAHELKIPSKGIKFIHPFEIESNHTTTLVIDFDADKSVVKADDKYILEPVVKILNEDETGFEKACIDSGGTVQTGSCCLSADDFPDTCLIGACGCSPENSHEVKICDCGEGECWSSTENGCVAS